MNGYAITRWIEVATEEAFSVEERLSTLRSIEWPGRDGSFAVWGDSDNNRRARYYTLTSAERSQLRGSRNLESNCCRSRKGPASTPSVVRWRVDTDGLGQRSISRIIYTLARSAARARCS